MKKIFLIINLFYLTNINANPLNNLFKKLNAKTIALPLIISTGALIKIFSDRRKINNLRKDIQEYRNICHDSNQVFEKIIRDTKK